jgi:predicted NodU family carbamoyl transferase
MELSKVDDGTRVRYLRRSADPDFNQLIRIFYTRHGKSLLARLRLAL